MLYSHSLLYSKSHISACRLFYPSLIFFLRYYQTVCAMTYNAPNTVNENHGGNATIPLLLTFPGAGQVRTPGVSWCTRFPFYLTLPNSTTVGKWAIKNKNLSLKGEAASVFIQKQLDKIISFHTSNEGYSRKRQSSMFHDVKAKKYLISGLDKNLNSNLPFGQASLKVCLPEPVSHLPAFKKFMVINNSQAFLLNSVLETFLQNGPRQEYSI